MIAYNHAVARSYSIPNGNFELVWGKVHEFARKLGGEVVWDGIEPLPDLSAEGRSVFLVRDSSRRYKGMVIVDYRRHLERYTVTALSYQKEAHASINIDDYE